MEKLQIKLSNYILLTMLAVFSTFTLAQVENSSTPPQLNKAKFNLDLLSFQGAEKGNTRLDVFMQVPFNEIQFILTGSAYTAGYTASVSIYSPDKEKLISEKTWNEKVEANEFEKTINKNNYNLSFKSFQLTPGKYFIRASVEDKESRKSFTQESEVSIKSFTAPLTVSDIMIISKQTATNDGNKIVPNVSRNVFSQVDGIPIFFEVYSNADTNVQISYKIFDEKKNELFTKTDSRKLDSGKTQIFHSIKDSTFSLGNYIIEVALLKNGTTISNSLKQFYSRWAGAPSNIKDLEKAIEQLIYIATDKELDYIEDGSSDNEKLQRYISFWKKKDPVPTTEDNEVFDEYYRRIDYANKHFTFYREGWKSDRGMVFIILGAPNNVDRHPFDYDSKPYEVWQYYNLNKEYVFTDESGFGDYRLITPLYGDDYRFR